MQNIPSLLQEIQNDGENGTKCGTGGADEGVIRSETELERRDKRSRINDDASNDAKVSHKRARIVSKIAVQKLQHQCVR